MKKFPLINYLAPLCGAALLGALGVSVIRDRAKDFFLSRLEAARSPSPRDISTWLEAAKKGDSKRAFYAAAKIAYPDEDPSLPAFESLMALREFGFSTTALTEMFNTIDCVYWKDIMELKDLSAALAPKPASDTDDIFNAVISNVKHINVPPGTMPSLTVMEVWNQRKGTVKDRIRLFCALLRQRGYEPLVAALLNARGEPVHLLCAVRKDGRERVFDMESSAVYDRSLQDILKSHEKGKCSGELRKKLDTDFSGKVTLMLPTEFAEHRLPDIKLAAALRKSNAGGLPVMRPDGPAADLLKAAAAEGFKPEDFRERFWGVSFSAIRSLQGFPPHWNRGFMPGQKPPPAGK